MSLVRLSDEELMTIGHEKYEQLKMATAEYYERRAAEPKVKKKSWHRTRRFYFDDHRLMEEFIKRYGRFHIVNVTGAGNLMDPYYDWHSREVGICLDSETFNTIKNIFKITKYQELRFNKRTERWYKNHPSDTYYIYGRVE